MEDESRQRILGYLREEDADAYLFSGPLARSTADKLVTLIDNRKERRPNACLLISTYGGDPNAAYRIGRILMNRYSKGFVRFFIGGYCKSAGTLLALSADELVFSCFGELGPLDTQIDRPNEIIGADSGLDIVQALDQITASAFDSFEQQMMNLIRRSGGAITTKVAAELATALTVGTMSPISAQVDPLRLGVARRANQIAMAYGQRLASKNVKSGTIERLANHYPVHGFVIDEGEARELFRIVRSSHENEKVLFEALEGFLRIPDEEGFISDLRTDLNDTEDTKPEAPNQEATAQANMGDRHGEVSTSNDGQLGSVEHTRTGNAGPNGSVS